MGDWLITGGAGFIGSHIAEALLKRGKSVRILDDFSTGREENLAAFKARLTVIKGDLNDPAALRRAVQGAEVIFHEAALPSVPRSVADPIASNRANIDGTVALLWAAKEAGVRRVIYAASSAAYGDSPTFPARRDAAPAAALALRRRQARRRALPLRLLALLRARDGVAALLQRLRPAAGPASRNTPPPSRSSPPPSSKTARRSSTATASSRATSPTSRTSSTRTCSPPTRPKRPEKSSTSAAARR